MMKRYLPFLTIVGILLTLTSATAAVTLTRVSLTHDGQQANKDVLWPHLSDDGRYAVFASAADNLLVDNMPGETIHIFVRDLETNALTLVSRADDGTAADKSSYYPVISGNGQFIAYASSATNLVADDTNGVQDIFVFDRLNQTTRRVSVATNGSQANGFSWEPSISDDGGIVAFQSLASNLVAGDTNSVYDVFVHEMVSGQTRRISVDSLGNQVAQQSIDPEVSGDGDAVVFTSYANLTGEGNTASAIYLYDLNIDAVERVSYKDGFFANDNAFDGYLSDDGRFVVYDSVDNHIVENDTNNTYDVFLFDRSKGETRRVSVDNSGNEGNGTSVALGLSGNGRYILLASEATNLVPDDTNGASDIFVYDSLLSTIQRVNVDANGNEGNNGAAVPAAISDDGGIVIFQSASTNLVPGDTNNQMDIFINEGGNTTAPITLVVTRITDYAVDLDPDTPPDFYVKVWIASADPSAPPHFDNRADHTVDQTEINPFWPFSRPVEPFANRTVIIEVWDYDEGGDTQADIHPAESKQRLTLSIDSATGRWDGDVAWPQNCSRGGDDTAVELCWDISILSESGDLDGDGLLDGWESHGLNADGNQTIDVDLPAIGVDPRHKDILVEIDYMVDPAPNGLSYRPQPAAVQTIVDAFANAPVSNPDGRSGIQLHVDYGPDAPLNWGAAATWGDLSEADVLPYTVYFGSCTTAPNGDVLYSWNAVDQLKPTYFAAGRAAVFHYNPWVNRLCPEQPTTLGISRGIEASDFLVAISSFTEIETQAGVLMHELGHNLGLRHGGGDDINYKPHYLSVMNYNYTTLGLFRDTSFGHFDYARHTFPALDEQNLDETIGLSPPLSIGYPFGVIYRCPGRDGFVLIRQADTPVDWNCDRDTDDSGVAADINGLNGIESQPLATQNDWDNLVYTGGVIGAYELSTASPAQTVLDDIAEEDLRPPPFIEAVIFLPLVVR